MREIAVRALPVDPRVLAVRLGALNPEPVVDLIGDLLGRAVNSFMNPRVESFARRHTDDADLLAIVCAIALVRDEPRHERRIGSSFLDNRASSLSFPGFTTVSPKSEMIIGPSLRRVDNLSTLTLLRVCDVRNGRRWVCAQRLVVGGWGVREGVVSGMVRLHHAHRSGIGSRFVTDVSVTDSLTRVV